MITLAVNPNSPVPPFEQLRVQIADAIRSGELGPGTQLPTVRQLARDLGLAPNTVARAYRSLDDDGLVCTDGRRGTTVADAQQLSDHERDRRLTIAAQRYLAEVRRLNATVEDACDRLAAVSQASHTRDPPSAIA